MKTLEDCVDAALAALTPALRARFATDPISTLRDEIGLRVQQADHLTNLRGDGGACDGVSFLGDGVILYAPTPYSRRENFTLGHELGHWLVDQTPPVFDWLFEQPDPNQELETVCDRIAQRLLLSQAQIDQVLDGPVQARHVIDLYRASNASLPVCAIGLAGRMPGLGGILIVEPGAADAAVVRYSSIRQDPVQGWPRVYPWPGQDVPAGHPLRHFRAGGTIRHRSFWAMPWGERAEYYLDAVEMRGRWIAVLADTDLWGAERFHPNSEREFDERPERTITCCGQTKTLRGYPCAGCDEVHCRVCGRCRCDRQQDELVMCAGGCYMKLRPNLLVDGLCEDCR